MLVALDLRHLRESAIAFVILEVAIHRQDAAVSAGNEENADMEDVVDDVGRILERQMEHGELVDGMIIIPRREYKDRDKLVGEAPDERGML